MILFIELRRSISVGFFNMRNQLHILGLFATFLFSYPVVAQYGGGGYGQPGMGGMNRNSQFSQTSSPPPSVFNNMPGILADRETRWLKDSLNLTKDQAKAVRKLNNDFAKQQQEDIKPIAGPGGTQPSPETIRQVQEIMLMTNEEKEEQLRGILTAEQWTKYKANKDVMIQQTGGFKPLPIGNKKP
jgi:hypothetical protein